MNRTAFQNSKTFSAFRHRNYRLWFTGQLISMVGTWMQSTAQGYLVYTLTGSAAYLGYVSFMAGLPSWLFMAYGGLVADRFSRRTMMLITQSTMMTLAFILAGLVFTNVVQPWHILVLAFFLGIANAFDTPARQALVIELVEREDMSNAIAFNSTIMNAGLIIGPSVAAAVYALTGPAWCFTINGLSFLGVISALLLIRIKPAPLAILRGSAFAAIVEGLRYVRGSQIVFTLVISVFVFNFIGFGPIALIPAWAVSVLKGDVTTTGLLNTARGVGAVLGGVLIAATVSRGMRGKIWAVSSLVMPLAMIAFALTRQLMLSLFLMGIIGFSMVTMLNNSNAMVQSLVPDELRGRVMGLYSLMFMGGGPLGALLAGTLSDRITPEVTFVACSVGILLFAIAVWFVRPAVRAMD